MRPHPEKISFRLKREENGFNVSSLPVRLQSSHQEPIDIPSSPSPPSSSASSTTSGNSHDTEDGDDLSNGDASKQLVLYDPTANGNREIEPVSDPIRFQPQPFRSFSARCAPRVLPSVGAFTVQCANCFKWRLIPTKEKYEEIREHLLDVPFICEAAREWKPDVSCDDPEDISQDGSRLWAIDKPNIAQPPPGWQRLLRIRGEGSTKFADVYYASPSGKRLRSMVEIQKYLLEHPEYIRDGVTMSQFSFQIPKPLQENYVRKRPTRFTAPPPEPAEANPIAWAGPAGPDGADFQLGRPALQLQLPPPTYEDPEHDLASRPAKKQARRTSSKQMYSSNPVYNHQHQINLEEPGQSRNRDYKL